ncbi:MULTISPECIES: MFS transporter [Rhizobium]|uniref:MFS transporter n=1 Tax=Rhizobium TaxID=379 RepID=UPI0010310614|nr:MFS transporter [Rhizobium leguminosarum]TAU13189.1 MFS transporter [Rhizobium leguminosarum]
MTSTIKERLPTHALAILGVTLFYRVATSMGPLAILLTLTEKLSLSIASLALTGWTLAGALSQPLWISVANRAGLQRTLLALGSVSFASHAGIGAVDGAVAAVVLSTVAGASLPPVTAQARALLAHILDSSRLRAAFDAEAALASSAFVIAPLIVAVSSLAGKVGPTVGCAILLGAVSLAFGYVGRGIERGSKENGELSKREDDARMGWRTLALIFSGTTAYGMLACVEVATVARVDDRTGTALVLSAWAATSFVGGLCFSRLKNADRLRFALLPVPVAACAIMATFTTSNLGLFSLVLVLSGFAVAPTTALLTSEVARVTPAFQQGKAFGWLQAGSWLGSAAATAVAGSIATRSLSFVLLFAALLAALSVVAIVSCRWRGSGAGEAQGADGARKQ